MDQYVRTHRVLAGVTFVVALLTYVLTLQPSVPFWDSGEFIAAAAWQQVPHPPGAPLWLVVAKLFHLLPFGDPAWRINLFSALCSASTAMLVYLSIVRLVRRWRGVDPDEPLAEHLPALGGGLVGALAFVWSDTNWSISLGAEVYAAGTLLVALMLWLMLRWSDAAGGAGHERYLLLVAYLLGLSIGVSQLALLAVPAIALVIYFRSREFTLGTFAGLIAATAVVFYLAIYRAPLEYIPWLLANIPLVAALLFAAVLALLAWAAYTRESAAFMAAGSFLLLVLGFSTALHITLRAGANPPMNQNQPDDFRSLGYYLERDQYGDVPVWPRRYRSESRYRQYQDVYGEWYAPVEESGDGGYRFEQINTSGELNFLFQYQIRHMYLRYFLWNFMGRVSDVPDAGSVLLRPDERTRQQFVVPDGDEGFPVTFYGLPLLLGLIGAVYHYRRDWKMAFVLTTLFLFTGVIAAVAQNQQQPQVRERDYLYAASFMAFAVWIGTGAAAGIELAGRRGSADAGDGADGDDAAGAGEAMPVRGGLALAACIVLVPLNMAIGGWTMHDRSGNWVAWDYAYNMLQSCEPDAILFTNGDNDTFPLWYLQDVAGVRRDVRVVNLTLGNTLWYIRQLKHRKHWDAAPVPIGFSDEQLDADSPARLVREKRVPPTVAVAVESDTSTGVGSGADSIVWTLTGEGSYGDGRQLIRLQDRLVAEIVSANRWRRPLYFAGSVPGSAWAGLDDYLQHEGLAYRIMPARQGGRHSIENFDAATMRQMLVENVITDDAYYTSPRRGLRMRLGDGRARLNVDDRRIFPQYWMSYLGFAEYELYRGGGARRAVEVIDAMERMIPPGAVEPPYWVSYSTARIVAEAGLDERARAYARRTITSIDRMADGWRYDRFARGYHPAQIKSEMLVLLGDYDMAIETYEALREYYPEDPNLRAQIEQLRYERQLLDRRDTAAALRELDAIIAGYAGADDPSMLNNQRAFKAQRADLADSLAARTDNTTVRDAAVDR